MKFIHQSEPLFGTEEKQALIDYMDAGAWLTEFTKTREFEERIAEYTGAKHCVVVSNGTVSLAVAMWALGIGPGDEVIVPDLTMIASANAVLLAGATPILVDISPDNLCIDLNLVERAITPKTKAVILVSLNGRCPDMDRTRAMAKRFSISIIEDAAQSLGSRVKGKHLGTFGVIGSFSFSVPKIITTGQGGALITDDAELAQRMRRIKDFGREKGGVDFHLSIGFNFKFTDLQAVIGLEQMRKLPQRVNRKKEIFALYRERLARVRNVRFVETNLEDVCPWFIDILVPDPTALAEWLRQANVGTRPVYPPIHSQPAYQRTGDYANSVSAARQGLWLPSSLTLSNEDIQFVCDKIVEFYER